MAPENVLAHGYNTSVDWWGLGVLLYVLLTGRQPFSSPKTDDPMVVMRRIVDDNWHVKYPPYLSAPAKVSPPTHHGQRLSTPWSCIALQSPRNMDSSLASSAASSGPVLWTVTAGEPSVKWPLAGLEGSSLEAASREERQSAAWQLKSLHGSQVLLIALHGRERRGIAGL